MTAVVMLFLFLPEVSPAGLGRGWLLLGVRFHVGGRCYPRDPRGQNSKAYALSVRPLLFFFCSDFGGGGGSLFADSIR